MIKCELEECTKMTKRNNNRAIIAIALTATTALAVSSTPADAASKGISGPTSISAGVFWPGDDTDLAINLRYALPTKKSLAVPSLTFIDVGAEVGHQTIIPLNIGILAGGQSSSPLESGNYYYGAGIGPYFRSSNVNLGGFLTVGYNLSAATYVEYKYQFVQDGSGSILSLGARF